MPLFKKSPSDSGSLSECHRKVLRRCRMILIKDIDVADILDDMSQDDGFKAEVRDQIMSYPAKDQRVGIFLDRLETRGEKAFTLFMESLKEHYKHLHYVLEETIRTIDDVDEARHRDRVAMTGDTVRKLLVSNMRRRTDISQSSESAEELELAYTVDGEDDYIACYSIPLRGKQQKEAWVRHECAPKLETQESQKDDTFMATLKKDLVLKRIFKQDIPENVKLPPKHCPLFVIDHDYVPPKRSTQSSRAASMRKTRSMGPERGADFESRLAHKEREKTPPPVPPKPGDLPPLSVKARTPEPTANGTEGSNVKLEDEETKDSKQEASDDSGKEDEVDTVVEKVDSGEAKKDDMDVVIEPEDSDTEVTAEESAGEAKPTVSEKPKVLPKPQLSPQTKECNKTEEEGNKDETHQRSPPPVPSHKPPMEEPKAPPVPSRNKSMHSGGPRFKTSPMTRPLSHVSEEHLEKLGQSPPVDRKPLPALPQDTENVPSDSEKANTSKVEHEIRSLINGLDAPIEVESDKGEVYEPIASGYNGPLPAAVDREKDKSVDGATKVSVDSQDRCATPNSMAESSIKSSTDSGIDNIPLLNGKVPPTMPKSLTIASIPHAAKAPNPATRPAIPTPLPRSNSDILVLPPYDSSDDDCYYEDIEGGKDGHSGSRTSTASYLTPNSYAKAFEKAIRANSSNPMVLTRDAVELSELEASGRIMLKCESMVVADIEEACLYAKPMGVSEEEDVHRHFRGTSLAYDKHGNACYIPSMHLRKHGDPEGEPWFYPIEITSRQASLFLNEENQEGCFVVYRPSNKTPGVAYNLSLSRGNGNIVHYHIIENAHGDVMIENHDHSFMNIRDLVEYFQRNKSQLATRLRRPLKEARMPVTPGYHYDTKWEINRTTVNLTGSIIGQGEYGVVCAALYHRLPVAVKVLQRSDCTTQDEDDFVAEGQIMMQLKHENVLRFIGLSVLAKPFFLITEYVHKGNLRDCLREGKVPADDIDTLFDVCIQVSSAMAYLESHRFVVHRDLAARNCLVMDDMCIKLSDFGRACYVVDDFYQAPKSEKISVKWAAPEVLTKCIYSSKSDVWALGIVFWEIFSGGDRPYTSLSGEQSAIYVTEGGRLDKPPGCSPDIYAIMKSCWRDAPEERPTFACLFDKLKSKSSIYYGTARDFNRNSVVSVFNSSTPIAAGGSPSHSRSRTASSSTMKHRNTMLIQSRPNSEFMQEKNESFSRDDILVDRKSRKENLSSSSEASLLSTMTTSTKDDLSRGDKIRKSLRKIINPNKVKRKMSARSELALAGTGKFVYQ